MEDKKIFKIWRGYRATYNALAKSDEGLDYWTLYSVIEPDGRRTEYWGAKPIGVITGELYPVKDVVETLPDELNVGDRYLVGHDGEDGSDAQYYVVEIAADMSQSTINPLGEHAVRIASKGYFNYQVINGKLISYELDIDCGRF